MENSPRIRSLIRLAIKNQDRSASCAKTARDARDIWHNDEAYKHWQAESAFYAELARRNMETAKKND